MEAINFRLDFPEHVASGRPFIARVWDNVNSTKNQVSVQIAQQVDTGRSQSGNGLVLSITQGTQDFSKNIVTTVLSMKKEIAIGMDLIDADETERLFNDSDAPSVDEVFGTPMEISVQENTEKNPNQPSQTPKTNPSTGVVLTSNKLPIYRHTSLVPSADVVRNFLVADVVVPTPKIAVRKPQLRRS